MTEQQIEDATREITRLESLKAEVVRCTSGPKFVPPVMESQFAKFSLQIRGYLCTKTNEQRWKVWTENPRGEVVGEITDRLEQAEALAVHIGRELLH